MIKMSALLALLGFALSSWAGRPLAPIMPTIPSQPQMVAGTDRPEFASPDQDSIIFYDDFEGSNAWTGVDLTNPGVTWHRDYYNAYSGQSWWSGKTVLNGYDNHWLQYLVSPVINLTGATNPALTCSLFWAVEEPSYYQSYDGWDGCNVWISGNGGFSWQVLEPEYPAYTCRNLYGFGWLWGGEFESDSIPGWAGFSQGWVSARFNLSAFAAPDIRLRFAFCSDQAICTADDPSLLGFFLDNIEVKSGSTVYLSNNADGLAFPSDFTMSAGLPSGNFWVLSTENYHTSNHSQNCEDQDFLSDALVSPLIPIPTGMSTVMSYWVNCLMFDTNSDSDAFLDDFYYIEVAPNNSPIWAPLVYDYATNGSQLTWVERVDGLWDGLRTTNINLTPWAGQNVRLRFRVVTDGDQVQPDSTGLFIDDVTLVSHFLPNNDVGASSLVIPFPTYDGQGPISCTVGLSNYGVLNQSQVPAFWSVNGSSTSLIPWSAITAGGTVYRNFTWTPPADGSFNFKAYTQLGSDQDHSNDTALAGLVEVTPAGLFELGYDHRQITYLPDFYYFNFQPGMGPMVRFTPADDGIPGILYGNTIRGMFHSAGTLNLHIFADGPGGSIGAEVYTATVQIPPNQLYPNAWAEINISDVGYLQGGHPNFWVWLEITSPDNTPHITGHLLDAFTPGHFFTYDGQNGAATPINFNIRATLTGSAGVGKGESDPAPHTFALYPNHPNPFNAATSISFRLPAPGLADLTVLDLLGRPVKTLLSGFQSSGSHQIRFDASNLPSGIYFCRLQFGEKTLLNKMLLLK